MYSKFNLFAHSFMKSLLITTSIITLSACAPRMEREFKQGCKASGGTSSFCSCIYDQLEDHYGKETLKKVGEMQQLPPADFEDRMYQYTLNCAKKM